MVYSRELAVRNPNYLKARQLKEKSQNFQILKPQEKEDALARQLEIFVKNEQLVELFSQKIAIKEIKRLLGLKESNTTIISRGKRLTVPREISLKIFASKAASRKFDKKFDKHMAELTGHFLYATSDNQRGFVANDENREALKRILFLVKKKTGKNLSTYPSKKSFRIIVGHQGLNNYLQNLTRQRSEIPFQKLKTIETKTHFLRGALSRVGKVGFVPKTGRIDFVISDVRKKHLIPQLAMLLTHHSIFPQLNPEKGIMTISDRRELEKLVGLEILPVSHKSKILNLLKNTPDKTRGPTIETYEEFQRRWYHNEPQTGLASVTQKKLWNAGKKKPDQVKRYLKLLATAKKLGIPIKQFKYTIEAQKSIVKGKPLFEQKKYPLVQTITEFQKEYGLETDFEKIMQDKELTKEIFKTLSEQQKNAVTRWLAGGPHSNQVKRALRRIRDNKKLRKKYEEI